MMRPKVRVIFMVVSVMIFALGCLPAMPAGGIHLDQIKVPAGFKISLYAENIPNARSMALGDKGTLFVGTREGEVYAILDRNKDHRGDEVVTLAKGLNSPNGVAFRDGHLYVAEVHRVIRYDKIEENLKYPPKYVVVNDSFPTDEHHGWKYIAFGPDGLLYVPVGAPCNVCESADERFATIMRMRPDGTGLEIYARGIRNTVGFDWHPQTRHLWFTNNGRDWMGDDLPPDTLHIAPNLGLHFGFPFCHGGHTPDPEFGKKRRCDEFARAAIDLPAHAASLGMKFYTGKMFPASYRNQIFIAEHGSWNRSAPVGYRVSLVNVDGDRALNYQVFAEGWLQGRKAWGRPVDVLVMPEGSLLVSDDRAGAIYRITYEKAE